MSYSDAVFNNTDRIKSKESIKSTESIKSKELIRRKLEIEEVLLEISNMFTAPANLERDINFALEKIGTLCGASRSYIFLIRENGITIDNTHEWCAEGVEPQKNNLQNASPDTCPWWMKKLRKDEIVHIADVSALPPEAAAEREVLEKQGIKSLIVLPLYVDGKLAGFMGMDNVRKSGKWKNDYISVLRIAVNLIGMGIQRKNAEKAIHAGEEIYRSMFKNAANLIILADKKGIIVDCNSRVEELLGYVQEELIEQPINNVIYPDYLKKFHESSEEIENRSFSLQ